MALISVKNLAIGYDKNIIVKGLSFDINKGDYLCIIGENGAGKSTLFKTLLGLQKPLGGNIDLGDELTRNGIGHLPQQRDVQKDFPASVIEVVLSGCLNKMGWRWIRVPSPRWLKKIPLWKVWWKPFYTKKEKVRASENINKMGITDLTHKCFRELSGGQQQRVLLARALCATSKIIFLDEPSAGLDPDAEQEMYKLLKKLNHDDGIAIVMVSHDIEAAQKYASHILKISKKSYSFNKNGGAK